MLRKHSMTVQADLDALYAAAERAGRALGCVYSSYDEFEAGSAEDRRRDGAVRRARIAAPAATLVLAAAFLLI